MWAVLFGAFCLAVVGLNVWLFSRWFRPIRSVAQPSTQHAPSAS
jgi:hypothetical protein